MKKQRWVPHEFDPEIVRGVYQLAHDFTMIMDYFGIPHFSTGGTLLGAVRHNGFIPWDDDLDFFVDECYASCIQEKVLPKFRGGVDFDYLCSKKQFRWPGFKIIYQEKGRRKTWIDLFLYQSFSKNGKQYLHIPNCIQFKYNPFHYELQDLEPVKHRFGETQINIPRNYELVLNSNFGSDDWKSEVQKYNHIFQDREVSHDVYDYLPAGPFGPISKHIENTITL